MTGLTTHILDLTVGGPACGVMVRLFTKQTTSWIQSLVAHTDENGRAALLTGDSVARGGYRLEFEIGRHFRASGMASAEPGFLETVAIEFNVTDPSTHYHVPLLVSPFGYSTYRGS
jgi:5-hydroxyisourate hydrolase